MFIFDEELGLLVERLRPLGYDIEHMQAAGLLHLEQVDAAELSPGEFAHRVRAIVDDADAKAVVIDSLNGYRPQCGKTWRPSCTCTSCSSI